MYFDAYILKSEETPSLDVTVTILAEKATAISVQKKHLPSPLIAGKGKILGDIITPVSQAEEWSCFEVLLFP